MFFFCKSDALHSIHVQFSVSFLVKTRYETVKEAALQDWRDLRDALFNTYISSQCPSSDSVSCQDCGAERQLFRCIDCLPNETVCEDCLQERHQHPHLHIFEIFQVY